MPMKDGLDPAYPLPRFLADQAEEAAGQAADGVRPASRAFKASILVAIATTIGIGIAALTAGDPMALFAEGTASLIDNSSSQSTPAIQPAAEASAPTASTADAQALLQTAKDAPGREEFAASEPAGQGQADDREPAPETLLTKFQAWAAQQDAQPPGESTQPVKDEPLAAVQAAARVVQDTPAPAAEEGRVPHRLLHKRRHVPAVRNARAEMRTQNLRKQVRRDHIRRTQSGRDERPPVQDARAQQQPVQDAQAAPSWLPAFGWRN